MPREAEPSLNERSFILEALQEDIRLDGRDLDQFRDIQISFGDEYGAADITLGKTRILAYTTATVTAPYPDRKFDGIFTINCELSPMATPAYEPNRSTDPSSHISRLLELSFRRSSALSTESLCLVAGKSVWTLSTTIHVLSQDGSLLSVTSLAVLCSLLYFRLPDTSVTGGELTVYSTKEREPIPLALLHWPLCVSWAVFEEGEKLVLDATMREEQCSEGEITVVANKSGEVFTISKQGGVPTDALVLLGCVDTALRKIRELDAIVKEALEREETRRDAGGLIKELRAENER